MVRMVGLFLGLNLIAALIGVSNAEFSKSEPKPRLTITQPTYKAAVYNHRPAFQYPALTLEDALVEIGKNLDVYEQQAVAAGARGVDILVFPEYGFSLGPDNIDLFLEDIPDPTTVTWNPCTEENRFPSTEVQQQLSCMARNNSLYLVAQMGDIKNCTPTPDGGVNTDCGFNGVYRYNTLVAFDPNGTLISRYDEKNFYFKFQFSNPPTAELVSFDTPFGRFGLFSLFDSFSDNPAVAVIENYNVDSVVSTTKWVDKPPFLHAAQWLESFAVGMNVNILAANLNSLGSGAYTPPGPAVYVGKDGQLLVATIPSRPKGVIVSKKGGAASLH